MYPRNSEMPFSSSVELAGCLHSIHSAKVLCKLWLFGYTFYLPPLTPWSVERGESWGVKWKL